MGLAFEPQGRWLASAEFNDFEVWLWPLEGETPAPGRLLFEPDDLQTGLAASPDGERLLMGSWSKGLRLLSLAEGAPRVLPGFKGPAGGVAFSPDGRLAAGICDLIRPSGPVIRVWDVATEEEFMVLDPDEELFRYDLQFTPDSDLLSGSASGLLRFDLATGEHAILYKGIIWGFAASADGRRVLMVELQDESDRSGHAVFLDLESGTATRLDRFGEDVASVAIDPGGTFAVTGDNDGEIRVGPVNGEELHLLLGHENRVPVLAVDPLGRWIASGSDDTTVRLWPMPDLTNPPLHTLPRDELIAKLKTLTNLRVVRDQESPTGWKLEVGPFPGWETVPTW